MNWSRAGGRVVAGSNPVTPTGENKGVKRLLSSFLFYILTDQGRLNYSYFSLI